MTVETLGIDIAKNVFQLHGVNHHGCVVLKRRVMRDQLLDMSRKSSAARSWSKPAPAARSAGRASLRRSAIRSRSLVRNM